MTWLIVLTCYLTVGYALALLSWLVFGRYQEHKVNPALVMLIIILIWPVLIVLIAAQQKPKP